MNLHQTSNTHQDQVNCGASVLVWWSFRSRLRNFAGCISSKIVLDLVFFFFFFWDEDGDGEDEW